MKTNQKTITWKKLLSTIAIVAATSAVETAQARLNRAVPETAYTWISATSGNYSDATRWSPMNVPLNPGDSGSVPGTATYTITLNGSSPNIDSFTINNANATLLFANLLSMTISGAFTNSGTVENSGQMGLTAGSITNNSGGVIRVDNVTNLFIQTPMLTNNGAITLNHSQAGNTTNLVIGADVALGGSGTVSGSNVIGNRISPNSSTERVTIGANQTIQGSMQFSTRFTNAGTFNSNVSQGMTLNPPNGVGFAVNNGMLQASNGSTLTLFAPATYANTNGTIRALAGSFVSLSNNPMIVGGTFTTADLTGSGGVIQPFDVATIQDVTSTGFINIPNSTTLQLLGTLTNNGVLMLNASASSTTLQMGNDVTLTGTGVVTSSNTQLNVIRGQNFSERLTLGSSMTLQGSFTLSLLRFTNNGVVNAYLSNGVNLHSGDAVGDTVNSGVLQASNGATLTLGSANINNTDGAIQALTGSIVKLNGSAITGGELIAINGSIQYSSFGSLTASARVEVFGTGNFDISGAPATVGSIEGDGNIFLGGKSLTEGTTNLSTTLAGVIQDGGVSGSGGGSLTKVGTGTLRLSGANTYTGGTMVNDGRLLANNTTGSGTGSGAVTVTNTTNTVLGGTGTIGGPVTVNNLAALLGGDATTATGALKVANNVTMNTGSVIELVLGASGAHSTLTRTGGTWTFAPNQRFTFINVGAQVGFYDNIITGLAANPGGTASWTITNAGFTGTFTYDGAGNIDLNLTAVTGAGLQLTSAVSRKTHGGAGTFDVPLPLTGQVGVECRGTTGNHTLVFTFNSNIVSGNASVTGGTGSVTGSPAFSANTMTVNLTGVANAQTVTVTLSNVTDSFSQVLPDTAIGIGFLRGDTNGNRSVNATDVSQTKLQSGQAVTNANFREDVNANGFINASDVSSVKLQSGTSLP
jgi:autotransporter-associated beta strand protein